MKQNSQQNVKYVKTACDLEIQNSMFLIKHRKLCFHCFSFLLGYVFEKLINVRLSFLQSIFILCFCLLSPSYETLAHYFSLYELVKSNDHFVHRFGYNTKVGIRHYESRVYELIKLFI